MTENIGLIVRVRAEAQSGYLDRLRRDIAGTVHDGAKAAMSMPVSTKRVFGDVGKNIRDQVQDAARAPSPTRPPAQDGEAQAGGDMGPMSGVLGKGAGMLGPLAALTIVGQGMFDMVKKAVGILSQASPALGASLKLIQRTLTMTLKPIGDLLAAFLRPIARTMREMHRRAHQAALQKGRPGSREYAEEYYNVLLGEARDRVFEWPSRDFLGAVQGLSLGDFVNMTGPGRVSKIMGYDLGKAVDYFLGDVGGSLRRVSRDVRNGLARVGTWLANDVSGAILGVGESVWNGLTGIGNWLVVDVGGSLQRVGREVWNGLTGVGNWLANDVWGAIRGVGESVWNGLAGVGNWLANDIWGAIRGVGESIWNGLAGIGQWFADMIRNLLDRVIDNILSGLGLGGGGGSGGNIIDNIAQGIGDLGKTIGEIINPGGGGKWLPWFADGGYVPPTPGGRIIGVAESGEGEWIVPDSKVRGFAQSVLGGGTVVNNLYLQGPVFGVDDLDRRVKRIMDASARESRRR